MKIHTMHMALTTKGDTDIIDITDRVQAHVDSSRLSEGSVTIFVPGSTAGLTTMEFEKNLSKDIKEAFEKIASKNDHYAHHYTWGDHNGYSHVRASLLGPSLIVPFVDGKLILGRWQQIVFIDFDTSKRKRDLVIQVIGI